MIKVLERGEKLNRIAELRKKCGLSQSELAAKIGVAQNTLSQYETNVRTPKHDTILKIAEALHVFPHEVYGLGEWVLYNQKFAIDVAHAFSILNYIQHSDADDVTADVVKHLMQDDFTDFDEVYQQLPDFLENLTTASIAGSVVGKDRSADDLLLAYEKLNAEGKKEAVKRIFELAELPKYQLKDSAVDNQEGKEK